MNEPLTGDGSQADKVSAERLVYVMPESAFGGSADVQINLRELWNILWGGKWLIIAVTTVFALSSVAYALLATEWYRSDVLLAPTDTRSTQSLGGQLGGLAALAGVTTSGADNAEPLAVLKSREFIRTFIEEYELMPVLFADQWDSSRGAWFLRNYEEAPDTREAVKYFQEDILKVQEDRDTGLVNVAVQWKDPELAAEWAATLVQRLNDRLRARALREAETNVAYLQAELGATSVVTLQQSIGRLLESELQKLMLARGSEEFAFKVLDPAEVPQEPVRPRRALIIILGTILGGMLSVLGVFVLSVARAGVDE
jgi:uncharacterized protein involved in exopolysaccharide biosynthesis